jgi:hypothetical protein
VTASRGGRRDHPLTGSVPPDVAAKRQDSQLRDNPVPGDRTDRPVAVPVGVLAGDDDAGLVSVLAGRHGGIVAPAGASRERAP